MQNEIAISILVHLVFGVIAATVFSVRMSAGPSVKTHTQFLVTVGPQNKPSVRSKRKISLAPNAPENNLASEGAVLSVFNDEKFRENGNDEGPNSEPHAVNYPSPQYPLIARQRRWQGDAMIELVTDDEGYVKKIILIQSTGHRILDEAALTAVKIWRANPSSIFRVPVKFKLN